ncbi:protein AHNAK2 [Vulpes vulpes]|uniref:Protein AHNAK2 n=1 Tax=Vulpes vulpes TaxID=9627 RepID=A0ABM5AP74_VULVU
MTPVGLDTSTGARPARRRPEEEARAGQRSGALEGRDPGGQRRERQLGSSLWASWEDIDLVSGRQLQPEEPDAETEEDQSVTEGPVDEIIRPRPQGSSPVYEYAAEGASFGLPDTPSRRASSSSGGRRSWWKRDSGDSRTFSRMSRRQEATEVTLQTEVEAGASGYSVTGGGDQGIFVKQVLKDSSAAKLFSLREGDQLLSATIFFDNIKYEDALKILQYSEPYKVQFQIRRKHPAAEDEEGASSGAQLGPEGSEGQDKDVADGCRETPPQTLEGSGDRERLLAKPREGRGRRPQKERLSWPKFQSITSKRRPGPRRSHSSSEAYGRGGAPDVSPTSTDTEAQPPAEEQEQKAGPDDQRRRSFLNLRFRVRSGKAPTLEGQPGTAGQGGPLAAGTVEEAGSHEDSQKASEPTMDSRREDRTAEVPEGPLALPSHRALGEGASVASRRRRKTKEVKDQEDAVSEGRPGPGSAPRQGGEGHGIEIGIARSALQGKGDTQGRQPEFQIQIPTTLKTPRFKFAKERIQETEEATAVQGQVHGEAGTLAEKAPFTEERRQEPELPAPRRPSVHLLEREAGAEGAEAAHGDGHQKEGEKDRDGKEDRTTTLRFKIPTFGWSPRKDGKPAGEKPELELDGKGRSTITVSTVHTEGRATQREGEERKPDTPGIHPTVGEDLTSDGQRKQADLSLGDKGVAARDSKFKMPKFKMPSFGASTPSKSLEASVDVSVPKIQAEVSVPSIEADVKTTDVTVELPPADLELTIPAAGLKLPEGQVPEGEPQEPSAAAGLKGHLPKVQMPSLKMPKVDIKAPQVDIKAPKLDLKGPKAEVSAPDVEVSLPSVEVDTQVPGAKLEADLSLGDKGVAARDSKFKMPKFKMPSFGASTPSKDLGTSVDVSVPKVGVEATLPSVGGEMRAPEAAVQLPTADVDLPGGELEVSLPEGEVSVSGLKGKAEGVKIKGQLPKVHMPSLKMPKVDIKAPQVDIKAPKLDLKGPKAEVSAPDVDVSLPSVEVDTQVPGAKLEADLTLGDKGVAARDSKFKMPKFKMPSFGASTPSKSLEASVDVSVPKIQAEVSVPSIEADVKTTDVTVELPPADLELTIPAAGLKLPEGQVPEGEPQEPSAAAGLKGHLPKVQMPSLKMPKVDIKAPQVDIKAPKLDLKGPKAEVSAPDVDVSLPSVEVDTQVPGAKLEADLSLGDKGVAARDSKFKMPKFKMPSFGASTPSKDLGTSVDVSVPKVGVEATLPSVGGEMRAPEAAVQLPTADVDLPGGELEVSLPEGEVSVSGLKGKAEGVKIKGQLPKVHMPSLKMPKVDITAPQVDIKAPQVDIKAPQVDIKAPKLDLKGPKAEVSAPDMDVSLPSVEVDTQVPGAKLEADLSLGDKGVAARDSKFKMPKFKMPSFGASTPSKSLEASVDVSVPKIQAEVSVPSIEADVKTTDVTVELPPADLELTIPAAGLKLPEGQVPEGEPQEPSAAAGLKGHLPKVQMPSLKMPKVDIKAPQVDIKAPKLDLKGPKAEVSAPDVDVSLPSVEVDTQVPGAKLEADLSLGDKGVAARDSKFKMPKFKMPSFGASTPSKDLGTSVDVSVPKVGVEATLPSVGGEMRAPEAAVQLPTADVDLPGGELEVSLPEGEVSVSGLKGKAEGVKIKGQLPKVHMPSLKMPKVDITAPQVDIKAPQVDIKAPQVDIKAPKLHLKGPKAEVSAPDVDVSLPSVEVDTQVPGAKLEADLSLGDKGVAARDSKFKMPKFKMPSFGASTPSKSLEASVDVSVPKIQAEVSVPSIEADVKTTDVTVELPPADLELTIPAAGLKLPEGQVPEGEPQEPSAAAGLKGHLPKVQMPSLKMPKVDIKAPQVDIKAPKLDLKGPKAEVSAPDVDVSLPSVEVDTQVPGAKLEADLSLGDKGVAARDSKFKMPKFKMPSFGASTPSKDLGTSVDVSVPKVGVEATLPSVGGEMRAPEAAVQLPTADVDLPGGELEVSLPEGEVSVSGLKGKAEGVKIKGQLPKVHMPSLKMPKVDITAPQVDIKAPQVDIKAPQVDIKAPKLDLKGPKAEVSAPDVDVSLPSVEVDTQVPGAKLEADLSLGDKGVAARDSKFKMPKFKMPSFGASTPSKSLEASVDVSVPKIQAEVSVPSIEADVKTTDVTVELPPADLELTIPAAGLKLPEGQVPEGEPQEPSAAAGLKGHLPKVQMPSLKMPKVDIKAPQVDIKAPKLDLKGPKAEVSAPDVDVSLPSVEVDTQVPGAKLEADLSLGDKGVAARDSKFKMPKFKMPSFGASTPSKDLGTSVDVSVPKVGVEATLPSVGGEMRAPEAAVQLPTADVDLPGGELEVSLPEGEVSVSGLKGKAEGVKIKGQLPKVHMPSLKMPKVDITAPQVDIKAPQVDIKAPKLDLKGPKAEVSAPDVDVSLPSVEVDTQVPGAKLEADLTLGDKGVAARDSKFKMPKFKMPSFGASTPSKSLEASVDVSVPKIQAEVSVPSIEADVKTTDVTVELPPADLELTIPAAGLKLPEGQVPEGEPQEPSAAAGLKGHLPKVQMPSLKMPKVDIKAPQVDIKAPKLDLKGPKAEVSAPDVDVSLPSVEVDTQVPGAKLEADLSLGDKGVAARDSKFKMPKFKMPSFGASTPSKDLGTSVDVSVPKVGVEATLPSVGGEMRAPEAAVQLPTADVDLPGGELEVSLPEGEVSVSGLKGKAEGVKIKGQLPKVHMPSLKMPKVDITAPQVDIKAPQVDIKAPQVDIKAPKLDLKGPKAEVSAPDVDVSLPSVEVDTQVPGAKLEADLSLGDKGVAARDSKFKMPKFKMPSFGASTPSKSLEASVDVSVPKIQAEVSVPSIEADVKTTDVTVELPPADLELTIPAAGLKLPEGQVPEGEPQEPSAAAGLKGHLPKVQMPSLKMPKVDIKAPQVDIKAPKLDLKGPKAEVSAPDVDVSLPSVEVDTQVPGAKLEADLSLGDKGVAARDSKFKMPKFKMPSFGASTPSKDLGTSVDVSVPKVGVEATLPSVGGEMRAPEAAVQLPTADVDLPGGELEVSLPEGEVSVSGLKGKAEGVKIKGQLPKVHMPSLKMPKVDITAPQVDIKAPQVDIKAPKLDLKGPKAEVSAPDVDVSLPSVEVDTQVPGAKLEADLTLGDKGVAARDSKFKMPKFKMPSFGASTPSKSLEASVDVSVPKIQAEVSVPSIEADVKTTDVTVELPPADLELTIPAAGLKLPEGQVPEGEPQEPSAAAGLKGHLPKVQMPSLKMPKVDIKAPQVDIKAPKLDLKGPKAEVSAPDVDVSLPSVEVDTQVPGAKLEADLSLGDKGVAARDSKFKMPKFKMPSFGASTPSKDLGTSVDVSVPKVGVEATLPSVGGEMRAPEAAVQLPTADVDLPGGELEVSLPEGEVSVSGLKGKAEGVKIKGQLPKVHMPSLKMPKVDITAPQVDIKAPQVDIKAPQVDIKAPKLDLKGPKAEVSAPDVDVSLPSVEVDTQVPGAKLEADLSLGDKGVAARDSKFKMPKFKMPSFGASTPSKSLEASVDVSVPKIQAEVSVPSIEADVKTTDVTVELPPADLELTIPAAGLKLPEGQVPEGEPQEPSAAAGLKGHLPKVQMPSLKMPKVDIKAPQVDIKAPKLDLKGPKAEVSAPDVDVSLPSVEVDTQVPGAKLEADLSLGDKGVAARDSKFKMPKFKMPSFGALTPSKDLGTSVDVSVPKVGVEATLPSVGGEMRAPEAAVQLPTADVDLPGGELEVSLPEGEVSVSGLKGKAEGVKIKGQLPKVHMPSLKMPKVDITAPQVDIKAPQVDIKAPQVDIKAPKLDLKGPKAEVSAPDVDVSLPSVEVDTQVPGAKLEADLSLGDKGVAARDSKFKMPKFKMPSFGASTPSKSLEASVDVSVPKIQAEVSVPSIEADVKTTDVTVELPPADLELTIPAAGLKLPEGQVPEGEPQEPSAAAGLKGHLPKVQMPSLKMPKVDIKAPQVDIKAPKLDLKGPKAEVSAPDVEVSLPSVEVDTQVPGAKLEADLSLGDKGVATRDSKFKMPKFKMPSFGASTPSKDLGTSVDVSVPKVGVEATLPSVGGEMRAPEAAVQLPTADVDLPGGELEVSLPEGEVSVSGLKGKAEGVKIKGQLPKVHMPSLKMPKVDITAPQVDIKAPQVDIKAPKLDLKGPKAEVSAPDVDVSLPSVEVDTQVPGAKLEADLTLGDKGVAARDSKFKMPKFKMPSFGASTPSKSLEASVDVSVPKIQAEVSVPSIEADVKTTDVTVELPPADLELTIPAAGLKLPEGQVPEGEPQEPSAAAGLKGHLPKVQMPSLKMPKVDIKAPQVDIKAPKLDLKGPKAEVSAPDVDVSLPSVEVDTQVPGAKLEADLSLGDKGVAARDSKFKMPKFKMPSFGASTPSKDLGTSVDVSVPKVGVEATLPSVGGEMRAPEAAVQLPTADVDLPGGELEVSLPEGEVSVSGLKGKAEGVKIKGQLPKVHMPSLKMPKVDITAPQVDIKAPQVDIKAPQVDIKAPKLDLKGPKAEVSAPDVDVSLPSVEVDTQVPGAKLEADLSLGDKGVAARDSKFKMPKFKMPSFGASTPSKSLEVSVDVSVPKIQAEVSVPSIEADVKTTDVTVELPPADLELTIPAAGLKLPEGQVPEGEPQEPSAAAGLKGHLPKVQMPSLKMPKVDIKAPQVDIKAPKLDLKGPKAEVSAPDVDVSLPSVEVDTQVPGAKLEADLSLGDKGVAARDSKFKMPKFKMPSFGASTPSKDLGTSVDVSVPKVGVEATLPSVGGEMRAPEAAVQLPTADVDLPGGELEVSLPEGEVSVSGLKGKAEGVKIKGQLPKVHMPSLKMPKVDITAPQVDIKVPQVDIKAPKLDLKGPKAEVSAPDVDVSLPSVEVDTQVPGAKLEADLSLGDKGVAARDSKFKMPKFKMPSFGASTPSKSLEASVDVSVPKIQAEVSVPSIEADVKTTDVTVELPPADLELTIPAAGLKLPEGQVPEGEPQEPSAAAGLKGHLPKVQMPSLKMPKVDIKAPQVDIKAPKLDLKGPKAEVSAPDVDVSLPSVEVDTQVPGAKLEADLSLGDKGVAARDSKFKMPKFKMPSFGASTPSKDLGTSVDVSVPKVGVEATLPSVGGEMRAPEAAVQLPTADVDLPGGELEVSLPEGEVSVSGLKGKAEGVKIKGQLPKVHMPSLKMPKVDITAPQVDIKAPQVDIKAPQVDIKAPKLDLKGPKAEVSAPDVDVSLPSVEVDTQVPGAKLEADLSLGDKGVAARDSKFKMPKFKMPSFGASTPSKSLEASVDVSVPKIQAEVSVPSIEADVKTTDVTVELPPADLELTIPAAGLKLPEGQVPEGEPQEPSAAAGLKGHLPKVQMPSLKMPKVDIKAPQVDIKAPKLDLKGPKAEVSAPDVDVSLPSVEVDTQVPGVNLEADLTLGDKGISFSHRDQRSFHVESDISSSFGKSDEKSKSKKSLFKMPKVFSPTGKTAKCSVTSSRESEVESSSPAPCDGVTLTKFQVTVPRGPISPELPCETPSVSQAASEPPSAASDVDLTSSESLLLSQSEGPTAPVDTALAESVGRVTFPKFHRPKFRVSLPKSDPGGVEPGGAEFASPTSPSLPVQGPDSSSTEATAFPMPGSQLPPAVVSAATAGTSAEPLVEAPGDSTERKGRGSPVKAPRLKLPSFSWSPKKGAESKADPGVSVVIDAGALGAPHGVRVPATEAHGDVALGKEEEAGGVRTHALVLQTVAPPGVKASTGGAGLLPGDPDRAHTASGEGGIGGAGAAAGPPDGADVNLHLPPAHVPSSDLRPGNATVEGSLSTGDLPVSKHGLSFGGSAKEAGLGDSSTSQLCGEGTAPSAEDPVLLSPTVGSPERAAAAGGAPAGSRESWFRMPSLRLPGFRRSSKERAGSAGPGAQSPTSATSAPGEGEALAAGQGQDVRVPGSEVDAPKSPQPLEAGADGAAAGSPAPSYSDVLQRHLDLHAPAAGVLASEARVRPGAGSLPLQVHGAPAEPCAPRGDAGRPPVPGPAGQGPVRGAGGAEEPPSQPEGPLRLRASSTDLLSQVSVVNVGQVWEDSVLSVQFPTLTVPRFSFPAPGSEADVFVPSLRELPCPQSGPDTALHEQGPGVRAAGIPTAAEARGPSEAAPICKVRVHIQGAEAESRQVTVHSTVTAVYTELSGPEAFPTQIVRESEVPVSETQTPSYGFSLLKGRVPEAPARARVHVVTADSGPRGRLPEAPEPVVPGADPVSGDLQSDTGEPFEIISTSVDLSGPPECSSDLHSGLGPADSCSDEEPAEILEFPSEEGQEAAAGLGGEGRAPRARPEGKRASGLFRFWLPSLGFSSSVAEASPDALAEAPSAAPVQTQPAARPPPSQEKGGWFRFPKLGFSSSPAKKSKSAEEGASPTEQTPQDEAGTFYDARESFSPEERGAGERAPGSMVASAARTELILLEPDGAARPPSAPRPASK